jgi:hypothetical protein
MTSACYSTMQPIRSGHTTSSDWQKPAQGSPHARGIPPVTWRLAIGQRPRAQTRDATCGRPRHVHTHRARGRLLWEAGRGRVSHACWRESMAVARAAGSALGSPLDRPVQALLYRFSTLEGRFCLGFSDSRPVLQGQVSPRH